MTAEANGQYAAEPINVAYTNDPEAACPGGRLLADCDTASKVLQDLAELASPQSPGNTETQAFTPIDAKIWRIPRWLSADCQVCDQRCEPALQTEGSEPTGLAKISFYEIAKD